MITSYSNHFSSIFLFSLLLLISCRKEDEDPDLQPITLACADIISDKSLSDVISDAGAVDYIVPCDISIEAKLTVNPGVVIQFANNTGFTIGTGGALNAIGSAASPIVFQGTSDNIGVWKGLFFNSSSTQNKLTFVTVKGGGSSSFDGTGTKANIRVKQNASLLITNSAVSKSGDVGLFTDGSASNDENPISFFADNSFNSNGGYPINISAACIDAIDEGTVFSGNGNNKILVRGSEINSTVKWRNASIPYLVQGDVVISPYVSTGGVYIESGTIIYFDASSSIGLGEYGNGSLQIIGTAAKRITLTSLNPVPGSWKGIGFQSTNSLNEITYADISYGGCCAFSGNTTHKGNVVVGAFSAGNVTISNTSINSSESCGIKVTTPLGLIQGSGVTFNSNLGGNICN